MWGDGCSQSEAEAPEALELLTPKVNRVSHSRHKGRAFKERA